MKLLYFSPLPLGLVFIFWLYYKCCEHEKSKTITEKFTQEQMDQSLANLAEGTVNLCGLWVLISLLIGMMCLSSK